MGRATSAQPKQAQPQSVKPAAKPTDKLTILQGIAAKARDLELEIKGLAETLQEKQKALNDLYSATMPELLDEIGIDHIGVPPQGNKPGVDFVMDTIYRASIASSWDESKRQAGFDVLRRCAAEALIKTEVSAKLPKGNLTAAKKIFSSLKKLNIKGAVLDMKQSVHAGTLSSWLREVYEDRGQQLPASDLEKIGGFVARSVKPVERKDT